MNRLQNGRAEGRALPKAVIKKARPAWLLWLVPLAAAALCVWFVYRDYVATGPLITIYFQNTEGLEAGNTSVQYRGSQVGVVKSLSLAPDLKHVKVTARLDGSAKDLAREGSIFWIVRPELKVGTISGLRTIVSGEYITVQPGHGAETNSFTAASEAPPDPQPGALLITIRAPSLDSLREHSPIFYRGVEVGEVLGDQLSEDAAGVLIRARIRQEYAPLVRGNSKFWNAGGVDFKFGLFKGAEVSAESASTLLSGGIAFATPPEPAQAVTNGAVFDLYEKPKDGWKDWSPAITLKLAENAPTNKSQASSKLPFQ